MLLCWTAGKASPIHDHPCDGCWMRCIEGGITETRYAMPSQDTTALIQTAEGTFSSPSVAYIDDNCGLHKVAAAGDGPAITMHLYAPPYTQCRVWLHPEDAQRVLRPVVTFFSEHGKIVTYDAPHCAASAERSASSEEQQSKAIASICDLEPTAATPAH